MELVRRIGKTRLGGWLKRHAPRRPLKAVAIWARDLEAVLRRSRPQHRAHDRAQAARLAAFRRETADETRS